MIGLGMPQRRCAFWHACSTAFRGDVLARNVAREEPIGGSCHSPPVAQGFQQFRREHDVAILLALALLDTNDHAFAIDIGGLQADSLGDAQPAA